ncbi:MAG: sigma-54 dependent transcriptional regulator [Acidobacteria bacterium]|nr:sigma-54 dependent transcriptional regulator [Acidobacteriota bacterium]
MTRPTLLVVDDEPAILDMLGRFAAEQGFDVVRCEGGQPALDYLGHHTADMALIDVRMPNINGLEVLRVIRDVAPACAVALMTGYAAVDTAVKAIKLGAIDFLSKPFDYDRLTRLFVMVREEAHRREAALEGGEDHGVEFHGMIGRGRAMTDLFNLVTRLAPYAGIALITGETGAGKELVARAFHAVGPRSSRRLVTVNCSAIVPTLFESELFGHARGSFTGAAEAKVGLFEHADGGTIFLDEIGELPLAVQAALLRVLETGEVQRVGSLDTRRVNVRILAATNRDLRADCASGRFRQDLYFRLNLIDVRVPPLRERREDIPSLASAFVRQFMARFGKPLAGLTPEALRLLRSARWDGNVRELRHAVERACMLADGEWITDRDLVGITVDHAPGPAETAAAPGQRPVPAAATDDDPSLVSVEREHVVRTLERAGGNKSRAAVLLGISRRTLYRLIEIHGLAHMVQGRKTDGSGDSAASPDDPAADDPAEIEEIP